MSREYIITPMRISGPQCPMVTDLIKLPEPDRGQCVGIVSTGFDPRDAWIRNLKCAIDTTNRDPYCLYGDTPNGSILGNIIADVSPKSDICMARISDIEQSPSDTAVAKAIRWAIGSGSKIIVLDICTRHQTHLVRKAIRIAESKGVIIIAPAISMTMDRSRLDYPGSAQSCLAVGGYSEEIESMRVTSMAAACFLPSSVSIADNHKGHVSAHGISIACAVAAGLLARERSIANQKQAIKVLMQQKGICHNKIKGIHVDNDFWNHKNRKGN